VDRQTLHDQAFSLANQKVGGNAMLGRLDAVKVAVDVSLWTFDQVSNYYANQVESAGDSAASQIAARNAQTQQLIQAAEQDRHDAILKLEDIKSYVADLMNHSFASANGSRIEVDRDVWSRLVERISQEK
jgi:hypothetical protein